MQTFDASSMLYAWDNYPIEQFPGLWNWMAQNLQSGVFTMPRAAFEEVKQKSPDCASWLRASSLRTVAETNEIVAEALQIKSLLEIQHDQYHPRGVDENDILIIATARIEQMELISDESPQVKLPHDKRKQKIPAVCQLPQVGVTCLSFVALIKRSGTVFQ